MLLGHVRFAIEPAHAQTDPGTQVEEVVDTEREAPFADFLGRALEIRELVAMRLLQRADHQVGELTPARTGL